MVTDGLTPLELTCEYGADPIGVGTPKPRFGCLLSSSHRGAMQSAYQVLVASNEEKLNQDIGDKWDSGKVDSAESTHIEYAGAGLVSAERCFWKVRVWDQDGRVSPYSSPAKFEMGLLHLNDWQGEWIGAEVGISSPLLRREFDLEGEVAEARVYVCGLGFSELYINGEKVGDHVLDPATVDYDKRLLYVTYDVADLLQKGRNALGLMLGNGWFCEPEEFEKIGDAEEYGSVTTSDLKMNNRYGDSPRATMQLNLKLDGGKSTSIVTEASWKTSPGPIVRNDLYGGETYDARLEKPGWNGADYDDADWSGVEVKDEPGGILEPQLMPAIKVIQTLKPVGLSNPKPGVFLYDFGQLFGGWIRMRVNGPAGTEVTIKYSARISEETGLIDMRRHPSPKETDFYILKGDSEEVFEPRFTFHPVRYVQIEGYPGQPEEDLEGRVVHSDMDLSSNFHSSNPLLDRIHKNVHWTFTNGLFGIPLDCLHREHWAWTDPATITGTLYPRKYMPLFWDKWLRDIRLAQDEKGQIPDIAPYYAAIGDAGGEEPGKFRSDAAWGGNYPILVWYLYQYYGDRRLLEEHYDSAKRWVDYLGSVAKDYIIDDGHLGDHMIAGDAPGEEEFVSSETPPPLVWTGYYYRDAATVARAAEALGKMDDAEEYGKLAEKIKDAFNREWLGEGADRYAGGSQTADAFPLALGIIPEDRRLGVVGNLVQTITEKHGGHLHTGNTGTTCLIDALTEHGHGEVMYGIVTKTDYPGWGYMVAEGATTIWESWSLESKVGDAESMIMWATIDEFFYNDLAGIKGPDYYGPTVMAPGFREIVIEPHPEGDLESAGATVKTVHGPVSSNWHKGEGSFSLEVDIPANSRAKVCVPMLGMADVRVTEDERAIWQDGDYLEGGKGIFGGEESGDYIRFEIGSGSYTFRLIGDKEH